MTVRDVARATGVPHSTLGGYFSGRHLPPLSQVDLLPAILDACGTSDRDTVKRWQDALRRVRRAPGPRPASAPVPYRGLACFQPEDAEWFFGRDALTGKVLDRLARDHPAGTGLLALVGPSGSGKSSLLRAGVIPAIQAGRPDCRILLFTPGSDPMAALAEQLVSLATSERGPTGGDVPTDPDRLIEFVSDAVDDDGPVVIVADQVEEVFTECADAHLRQAFLNVLLAAAQPATVLLGLRADFYHRVLREHLLIPVLEECQVAVGPMNEAELREAIVGPARKARLEVENGLVELMLRDLTPLAGRDGWPTYEAGALPLLSHALRATWEQGSRGRLTVADYQNIGGIHGGVARTADAVFDSLAITEQQVARRLLVRLVRVGEEGSNTRRRVTHAELDQLLPAEKPAVPADVLGRVLERFVEQRLVTATADTVEITHEALVAAWPRLRSWIEADRRRLLIGQQLEEDAQKWHREHRDAAGLYRGSRLSGAREWAETGGRRDLSGLTREFLDASIRRDRRRVRALCQVVAALAGLLLLAVMGGAYAIQQRGEALEQRAAVIVERNVALSRMLAIRSERLGETDPALASQVALAAYEIAPTVEARSSLLSTSTRPEVTRTLAADGVLQELTLNQARDLLATVSADGSVGLWDVTDPYHPGSGSTEFPGFEGVPNAVAFDPNGRILAVAGTNRTVYIYDIADPAVPVDLGVRLTGPNDEIHSVAFSPDGATLAAGAQDSTVRLWDVTTSAAPTPLGGPLAGPDESVTAVAFSPDGTLLAAGGFDRTVHLWDLTGSATPTEASASLAGPELAVFAIGFSADGSTLAATSADKKVYQWDLARPELTDSQPAEVLTGPTSWVNTVTFSADGQTIAAGSSDGHAWLWDRSTGDAIATLPHSGPVTGVAFESHDALYTSAADGAVRRWTVPGPTLAAATDTIHGVLHHPHAAIVAAASGNGEVHLWDINRSQHPRLLTAPLTSPRKDSFLVGSVAINPAGDMLVAGGLDGAIWRWDITRPREPRQVTDPLPGLSTFAEHLKFGPDGDILAAGAADGTVHLWTLTNPDTPRPLAALTEPDGNIYSVAFSPDGHILAAGGLDKVARLWDVTNPNEPLMLGDPLGGHTDPVYSVAFSPDGRTLAVGSADETIRLWDITNPVSPQPIATLTDANGYIIWASFSPDNTLLAAAATDRTVWLWDITDLDRPEVYAALTGHTESVQSVAFAPEGNLLAAGGQDTTVRLWRTQAEHVAERICATTGDPITSQEWRQHVPGLSYRALC